MTTSKIVLQTFYVNTKSSNVIPTAEIKTE